MEQHPIPQQISSYQFKLVGDMTLKQFFQVAGGVVVALLFYSTPLHPIIKWPIIFVCVLLGIALAFLPFEERPLEKWIIAFFRSIYSPTIYNWKKTETPEQFYSDSAPAPNIQGVPLTQPAEPNAAKLEAAEQSFLSKISSLWSVPFASQPKTANVTGVSAPAVDPVKHVFNTPVATEQPKPTASKPAPAPSINVPTQMPTVITKSAPKIVVEEAATSKGPSHAVTADLSTQVVPSTQITGNLAEFSVDAAPPIPPTVPNTIVGQVIDQDRKIIEAAILEIKDANGRPVRALKSNKAGHFIIVTPLSNGRYEISTEKEGFQFKPVSFETKGDIIPPIAIKGVKA